MRQYLNPENRDATNDLLMVMQVVSLTDGFGYTSKSSPLGFYTARNGKGADHRRIYLLCRKLRDDGDCIVSTSSLSSWGYGRFQCESTGQYAHRFTWQSFVGELNQSLVLDHLCRNRACVNPSHLREITVKDNILCGEGIAVKNLLKTHCKNGHEFNKGNTYWRKNTKHRACKACGNLRKIESRLKVKNISKALIASLLIIMSTSACRGRPPKLDWKLWAGDSEQAGITRSQDPDTMKCEDVRFEEYLCMSYSDFKRNTLKFIESCKKWDTTSSMTTTEFMEMASDPLMRPVVIELMKDTTKKLESMGGMFR